MWIGDIYATKKYLYKRTIHNYILSNIQCFFFRIFYTTLYWFPIDYDIYSMLGEKYNKKSAWFYIYVLWALEGICGIILFLRNNTDGHIIHKAMIILITKLVSLAPSYIDKRNRKIKKTKRGSTRDG